MKKGIISLGLVGILLGAMCLGMIGLVPNVQGANDWIERIIADPSIDVNSIAIGDADNNGNNDVVIGMSLTNDELRIYTKKDDTWIEEVIDDYSAGVYAVAIGDADNDGFNEVVAGLETAPNELIVYKKDDGVWNSDAIANPSIDVNTLAIGDVDNDGKNEVVIGMDSTSNEIRAFEYNGAVWLPDHTIDVPATVNTIAIGDADNDMNNELVIGMNSAAPDFEVRAYDYVAPNWVVDNISSAPTDVLSVTIGDGDNDGSNEVVVGMKETPNEIRLYEKNGGWTEMFAPVPNVNADVNSVAIGDVDNDAKNEILAGLATTNGEIIAFEYNWVIADWTSEIIADTPASVTSVAIGDADGESNNEVVIGMVSTTNEVRLYSLDRGELVFVSHNDGDYVSGNERFDLFVTSNYVDSVKFYLNDVVIFQDTNDPYQFVLDTTTLMDDTTYTIKAEGIRFNAPPLIDSVDVIVKNSAIVGDYISVSAMEFEYNPDQDVAVVVSTMSPPAYDYVNFVVSYTDPSGNDMITMKDNLPVATEYLVVLPIASDAELGLYDVNVQAFGYDGDFLIWEAANSTAFNVSGKNLNEILDDILQNMLDELKEVQIALNNSINTLTEVVGDEHELSRSEILARVNDTIDELQGFDQTVIDHDTEIKAILDSLDDLIIDYHNLTKTDIIGAINLTLNDINDLDAHLTQEAQDIRTELGTSISDETTEIDTNLAAHDDNLDSAKEDAKKASDQLAMYQLVTMVLLIIALVFLLISFILVNKGYKMMKDAKGRSKIVDKPPKEELPDVIIEEDEQIEGAIDDALGDIDTAESEEP